jgi:pimeloyl-ACP methyl ester carboxylesterase
VTTDPADPIGQLYREFAQGRVGRRAFMQKAAALGVAGAAAPALSLLRASPGAAAVEDAARAATAADRLDLAEWSYFWLGVKTKTLPYGDVVDGSQMYVEYWTPAKVTRPFSIVLVHGGGGQGLDWLQTADGRPGWAMRFVQAGYRVYLVDRPGHGRSPFHPDLDGPFPERAATYALMEHQFTAPQAVADPYGPQAKLHTQWPGTGQLGDPTLDQVIAGQGGAFLPNLAATHAVWAKRGGELLDKIGPAVVMAHSMGGPSCWIYGDGRPDLVAGLVGVEPAGPPFGPLAYGVAASPLAYDPPVADASDLQTVEVQPSQAGRAPYRLQAEPARQLKNLKRIPIALVTSPAYYHWPYDPGTVAFLRQAGCTVDHIELDKLGIAGNDHFMMMERNSDQVLAPILHWLETRAKAPAGKTPVAAFATRAPGTKDDTTALKLARQGFFWVGVEHKQTPYGVIAGAPMYVQYLIPRVVRHETPVVLVHGGSGQMLHYMGPGDGAAGWAHYYAQAGYKVYLVDRPGHGRCVYHPDALGPINPQPTYQAITADTRRGAEGGQWPGTGLIGDPLVDQLMASQNATPSDTALAQDLWKRCGAALLDRLGPVILQTHSAGGPFGWLVANERPDKIKLLLSFEGAAGPLLPPTPPTGQVAPKPVDLSRLQGVRIGYAVAEHSGRTQGPAIVQALTRWGAHAEFIPLKDHGLIGNGHFAMLEKNRKAVFEALRGWVEQG